ncbi:MAG: hypothetical protein Q9166_007935 [cf. Caloplaca sp. 2 TL-2023]
MDRNERRAPDHIHLHNLPDQSTEFPNGLPFTRESDGNIRIDIGQDLAPFIRYLIYAVRTLMADLDKTDGRTLRQAENLKNLRETLNTFMKRKDTLTDTLSQKHRQLQDNFFMHEKRFKESQERIVQHTQRIQKIESYVDTENTRRQKNPMHRPKTSPGKRGSSDTLSDYDQVVNHLRSMNLGGEVKLDSAGSLDSDAASSSTYPDKNRTTNSDVHDCRGEVAGLRQVIESDRKICDDTFGHLLGLIELVDGVLANHNTDLKTARRRLQIMDRNISTTLQRVNDLKSDQDRINLRIANMEERSELVIRVLEEENTQRRRGDDILEERFEARIRDQHNEWRRANDNLRQQMTAQLKQQYHHSSAQQRSLTALVNRLFSGEAESGLSSALERVNQLSQGEVRALRALLDQVFSGQVESGLSKAIVQVNESVKQADQSAKQDTVALKRRLGEVLSGQVESGLSCAIEKTNTDVQTAIRKADANPAYPDPRSSEFPPTIASGQASSSHQYMTAATDSVVIDGSHTGGHQVPASDQRRTGFSLDRSATNNGFGMPAIEQRRTSHVPNGFTGNTISELSDDSTSLSPTKRKAPVSSQNNSSRFKRSREVKIGPPIPGYRRCADALNGGSCTALQARPRGEAEEAMRWRCKDHRECRAWPGGPDLFTGRYRK